MATVKQGTGGINKTRPVSQHRFEFKMKIGWQIRAQKNKMALLEQEMLLKPLHVGVGIDVTATHLFRNGSSAKKEHCRIKEYAKISG